MKRIRRKLLEEKKKRRKEEKKSLDACREFIEKLCKCLHLTTATIGSSRSCWYMKLAFGKDGIACSTVDEDNNLKGVCGTWSSTRKHLYMQIAEVLLDGAKLNIWRDELKDPVSVDLPFKTLEEAFIWCDLHGSENLGS